MSFPGEELEILEPPWFTWGGDHEELLQGPFFTPSRGNDLQFPLPDTTRSRASSVASFGSIDSGASHPPRTGRRRKKGVDIRWEDFDSQPPAYMSKEEASAPIDRVFSLPNSYDTTAGCGEKSTQQLSHNSILDSVDISEQNYRKRKQHSPEDEGEHQKSARRKTHSPIRPSLACPFYIFDPTRYSSCSGCYLTRILALKDHIRCHHMQPKQCELCFGILCEDMPLQENIQGQKCETCKHFAPGWINSEQEYKVLSPNLRTQNMTDSDEWFEIYEIIFPGSRRPRSAYLHPESSAYLQGVREFLKDRGPAMMMEKLKESSIMKRDINLDRLERSLKHALISVFDKWIEP